MKDERLAGSIFKSKNAGVMRSMRAPRHFPILEITGGIFRKERDASAQQRGLNPLPLSGNRTIHESGQNSVARIHSC